MPSMQKVWVQPPALGVERGHINNTKSHAPRPVAVDVKGKSTEVKTQGMFSWWKETLPGSLLA